MIIVHYILCEEMNNDMTTNEVLDKLTEMIEQYVKSSGSGLHSNSTRYSYINGLKNYFVPYLARRRHEGTLEVNIDFKYLECLLSDNMRRVNRDKDNDAARGKSLAMQKEVSLVPFKSTLFQRDAVCTKYCLTHRFKDGADDEEALAAAYDMAEELELTPAPHAESAMP